MAVRQKPLPPDLMRARQSVAAHPDVLNSQLFTTSGGDWGLRIHVRPGTSTPIPEFEELEKRFPVDYQSGPAPLPEARPAYPDRGE